MNPVSYAAQLYFSEPQCYSRGYYVTGCFMGMCKLNTPPSGEPQRQDWPTYHGVSFILSLTNMAHIRTLRENTKRGYCTKTIICTVLADLNMFSPLLPFSATVANDLLVPDTVPLHPFTSLIAFFCSWGRIVKPSTCRCG